MAWISAWAVMSIVCQTTLCVQLTTSPSRAMQAPNGVWPRSTPSCAFSIARRMKPASVTGQMLSRRTWPVIVGTHNRAGCEVRSVISSERPGPIVEDRVLRPIFIIEVPPLEIVNREALTLHGAAQQLTMPPGERRAAGIIRIRARGHLIIEAHHLGRLPGFQVVQGQVDRAPAVVARALSGIRDEDAFVGWRAVPKHFCDIPGAVGIVDQQAVAHGVQLLMGAQQRFRGGALHESLRLPIKDSAHEIVGRGVADIELDGGIERRKLYQIGLAEIAGFRGRLCRHRPAAQLLDWFERLDMSASLILTGNLPSRERDAAAEDGFSSSALIAAMKRQRFPVVQTPIWKAEDIGRNFFERVVVVPLNKRGELAVLFENVQRVVIPAVFADQAAAALRRGCGLGK